MFGGIPNSEIDMLKKYWDTFPTLKNELFKEKDIPYSELIDENIEEKISNNKDVKKYIEEYKKEFKEFNKYLKEELIDQNQTLNIYKEKEKITETIREKYQNIKLIDFYDSYQIFINNWETILLDLEILQKEGLKALNKVDPNMKYRKNKKKELEEYQDGWIGRILPYELVQEEYYKNDKEKLEELTKELANTENEKKELLESIDINDKANIVKEDSDEIDSKKLKAIISEINKKAKKGIEFEEGTYEAIILKISKVDTEIRKHKNEIKKTKAELEEKTKNKIETIETEEALKLLEKKWIQPLCKEIEELPSKMLKEFTQKIKQLNNKYKKSFKAIDQEIKNTENEISNILEELTGSEFDMKGIEEFKALLGG